MRRAEPPRATIGGLSEHYDCLLLDSYGVLVDGSGAKPHAARAISFLRERGTGFLIVTNDASRSADTSSRRYRQLGMDIPPELIVSSGALLAPHFESHDLRGAKTIVLGTPDSHQFAREAGAVIVEPDATTDIDAVIVSDDDGYPFLHAVEETISALFRAYNRGRKPALILPNPDLIYPKDAFRVGLTSGAVAALIETALARRFPELQLSFTSLGKPHAPIYAEARRRAGTDSIVMIGDQLETDIAGATEAGIDSALLLTGITRWTGPRDGISPTFILSSLEVP